MPAPNSALRVVIVGAGIQGLAVALLMTETALSSSIKIYSREPVLGTTSAVAGGLIEPGFLPEYDDRIGQWFAASRRRLRAMLADPAWYIKTSPVQVLWRQDPGAPPWAGLVDDFASSPSSRPPYVQAWSYTTEIVETPRHLQELARRVTARGVQIVQREVAALAELGGEAELIVNCAGVGARQLGDDLVSPARGQVVIVERSAQIPDQVILDSERFAYVIPRITDVVVGGTYDLDDWGRDLRPAVADQIMQRAAVLLPALAGARVLDHRVGLRPVRQPTPRLELEVAAAGTLIAHCYGAGGAGITLSYGMAADLLAQLQHALRQQPVARA